MLLHQQVSDGHQTLGVIGGSHEPSVVRMGLGTVGERGHQSWEIPGPRKARMGPRKGACRQRKMTVADWERGAPFQYEVDFLLEAPLGLRSYRGKPFQVLL